MFPHERRKSLERVPIERAVSPLLIQKKKNLTPSGSMLELSGL